MNRHLLLSLSCLASASMGYGLVKWMRPQTATPARSQPAALAQVAIASPVVSTTAPAPVPVDPLLLRIQQTAAADYPDLWKELEKLPADSHRELWQQLLSVYWARKDPVAGYAFLEKQNVPPALEWVLLREWWRLDPQHLQNEAKANSTLIDTALEALASADNVEGWKALITVETYIGSDSESAALLTRLAEKDFAETERWCRGNLTEKFFSEAYPTILGGLAKHNPQEAWSLACGNEEPLACQEVVMQIWARLEPEAAMAALREIEATLPTSSPPGQDWVPKPMTGVRGAAVAALFKKDPTAALQLAESLHASSGNIEEITEQLAGALPKDPAKLITLLAQIDGAETSKLRGYLTAAAAQVSWADAAAATVVLSQQITEPQVIAHALAQWLREDDAAAVQFLSGQPDDVRREAWSQLRGTSLAKTSPETLAAMLKDVEILPAGILSDLAGLREFSMLSQRGLVNEETAFYLTETALKLPKGPGRDEVQRKVFANQLAITDPAQAQQYVTDILSRDGHTPEQQASLAQSLGQTWATVDAQTASEYISAQHPGPLRDHLAQGLSEALSWDDPNSAFVWAKSITDSKTRQNALKSVYSAWKETDVAAADASRSGLNAEDLQALDATAKEDSQ